MPEGRGIGGLDEKGEGLRSTNWLLQNSHKDVRYSTGSTVSNIVITMCGARWALGILGETLRKVYNCVTAVLYT